MRGYRIENREKENLKDEMCLSCTHTYLNKKHNINALKL